MIGAKQSVRLDLEQCPRNELLGHAERNHNSLADALAEDLSVWGGWGGE